MANSAEWPGPIALGAYFPGFPQDPGVVSGWVKRSGASPAIVHSFQDWDGRDTAFNASAASAVYAMAAVPMVTWQPLNWAQVVSGEHDTHARAYADAIRRFRQPILLRFAHEMNGSWIPWRDAPGRFRDTWRRLHSLFDAAGAGNARWVWSPHVVDRRAADFEPYYPGDAHVDWVALDGYNWGSRWRSGWRSFDAIFADSYRRIRSLSARPLMLAEIGCAERGGDKAAWIRDAFLSAMPRRYPAVSAVVWFDEHRRDHADWRIDSSPASLAAWRDVATHPHYRGRLAL
jgi:hypothetical protein